MGFFSGFCLFVFVVTNIAAINRSVHLCLHIFPGELLGQILKSRTPGSKGQCLIVLLDIAPYGWDHFAFPPATWYLVLFKKYLHLHDLVFSFEPLVKPGRTVIS